MRHVPRLYVRDSLESGAAFALPEDQSKYLLRVMRLAEGAEVRVFNGKQGEWLCSLTVNGKSAELVPERQVRAQYNASPLTLLFAPIKKTRTEFIVEKATELGVTEIIPVYTEYTQTRRIRTDRMQAIVIEAAEQTERMDEPAIHEGRPLADALAQWDPAMPLLYCDEGSAASPIRQHLNRLQDRPGGILIGPEGGFSPDEREMLRALDFVIPITLGPRILRAETAVVSALTLWQSLVGDWQNDPYLPET